MVISGGSNSHRDLVHGSGRPIHLIVQSHDQISSFQERLRKADVVMIRPLGLRHGFSIVCAGVVTLLCGCVEVPSRTGIDFDGVPPTLPREPRLRMPTMDMAEAIVRTPVRTDWWSSVDSSKQAGTDTPANPSQLAILGFQSPVGTTTGEGIMLRLSMCLANSHVDLVERQVIDQIVKELKMSDIQDISSSELASRVGKLIKARYLLVGVVTADDRTVVDVDLQGYYAEADLASYRGEYTQYRSELSSYLDDIERKYIPQYEAMYRSNDYWYIYAASLATLRGSLSKVRADLAMADQGNSNDSGISRERFPWVILPIQPNNSGSPSSYAGYASTSETQYNPLTLYDKARLPLSSTAIEKRAAREPEFRKVFNVPTVTPEVGIRLIDADTGRVVAMGTFGCRDTSTGEAMKRISEEMGKKVYESLFGP